jgi:tight adherence protein B
MLSPDVLGLSVFFGMSASYGLFVTSQRTRRQAEALEFARRLGPGGAGPRLERAAETGLANRLLGPVGEWIHSMTLRAGVPLTVTQVVAASAATAVLGSTVGGMVHGVPWALAGLTMGAFPMISLRQRAHELDAKVTAQLPDAIDLMTRALRVGHSFPEAMRIAAAESEEPLATLFGDVAEENGLGLELRDCLEKMLHKVPHNFEVRLFISCVLLNRETGGNAVEILESVARTIRERAVFIEKVAAMTTEVRASAAVLAAMPFIAAGGLMLVSPDYLKPLFEVAIGQKLLFGAGLLMVCGMAIMSRVATVEAE